MPMVLWLSRLPHFWVRLAWDCMVFVMPFLILRETIRLKWTSDWLRTRNWRAWGLAWVVMYPFWYKEAGYGQFNLLNLWLVLIALRWLVNGAVESPDRRQEWAEVGAGVLVAATLFLKPTQLFLVPALMAVGFASGGLWRWIRFVSGMGLLSLVLAVIYAMLSSTHGLIQDHLDWVAFMRISTAKHLMGTNNYGLPTLLVRLGAGAWVAGPRFALFGLSVAALTAWRWRRLPALPRDCAVGWMLAFSPMSWKANFGVCLPLVAWLAQSAVAGERPKAWLGLLAIFLISRASEYWMGPVVMDAFGSVAAPLSLLALAIWVRWKNSPTEKQLQV